jgi:hypothetical protein
VSRLFWLIGIVAALAAAAQSVVPGMVDRGLAHELRQYTGPASRTQVAVVAIPFWTLVSGRFQDLHLAVEDWQAGPLTVSQVRVNWQDGGLNLPDLVNQHALVVTRLGRMRVTIAVDGPALAALLEKSGRLQHAQVDVGPKLLTLRGLVHLHGLTGRVNAKGTLSVSPNRHQILFHPTVVDGVSIPFPATLTVFDVSELNLPVPLAIRLVRLAPPDVVVEAETP